MMRACPTFVINLAHDVDRRRHMERELAMVGLPAEFVPAVDGRTLTERDRGAYDRAKALRVYGVDMLDAEIGCYLSHYRLWERMLRDNIEVALILEDDVEISPALPGVIADLIAEEAPEWLVVRLESLRGKIVDPRGAKFTGRRVRALDGGELYRLKTHVLGFGAYLIRQEGARRMVDYGRSIFMPVDQTMDRYWENGIVPYIVRPLPVRQRHDFESRIGLRPPARRRAQPWPYRLLCRRQRVVDGIRKRVFSLLL